MADSYQFKQNLLKNMNFNDPYVLLMELAEGFYGENGTVGNVHEKGYSELVEEYSETNNVPWFIKTHGIIAVDEILMISIHEETDIICKISESDYGLVPLRFLHMNHKFYDSLLDSYAVRLGFADGSAEFKGEVDMEILQNMLSIKPIALFKPFEQFGYFERISTIELSKNALKNNNF